METPGSPAWRRARRTELLTVARRSRRPEGGFGWLGDDGELVADHPVQLWITARMTYVFALAHVDGEPDALELAAHGVEALAGMFHDDEHGGWFAELEPDGTPRTTVKQCYEHAFVLLAAGAAGAAGVEGAEDLLADAAVVHSTRFWDADAGRCVEQMSRDWTDVDAYRGANSNMHTVEAYLQTADVTGEPAWRERALAICERIIGVHARAHDWRVPEHYDADWTPLPSYHEEIPADPFRPYGVTPGHAFEWARLLVQLAAADDDVPSWVRPAAMSLVERAVADAVGDRAGIPYTTDWHGRAVVEERFHWVLAEAVLAAEALHRDTGQSLYEGLARRWWGEIAEHVVDADGSWRHELSVHLQPSSRTWSGRPDAYHAFNALTLPDLPLAPTAVLALARTT